MITRRDVFQAIADPTRREIIHLLSRRSHNLSGVVDQFRVSRPAIAKHLRILAECGLVEVREEGREKFFHARLEGLREVADWTEQYKAFWTRKLDALGEYLEQSASRSKKSKTVRSKTKKKKT
jgi:DNA-binding transcriptional ArsR family regulator|nr:MAG: transcriptional regulator [Bacteroidota bacterium]